MRTDFKLVKDFSRYPEIRFLNRIHYIPPFLYALLIIWHMGIPGPRLGILHFYDRTLPLYVLHQFSHTHDWSGQVQVERRQ